MKRSPFFRVSLGLVPTVEKNGSRSFNDKDKFSFFYNTKYFELNILDNPA